MKTRTLDPGRITAIALIAIASLGLAYLHFSKGGDTVSVPKGAHAGQLSLHSCTYGTEDGAYDADCGTLVVPENRAKPDSRLIALPVTRIRARSAHPAEPIFRLQGGPGLTNMKFAKASRLADRHDVVLVGYRGIDGSVRLDCPEVVSALKHSADFLGEKSMRAYADGYRSCATRLRDDGVDLAGYTLTERVDDLEAARRALGYDRIDLLSESVGTRTALIYAWRHPASIHRSAMIGVNPPGGFLWSPKASDDLLHRYSRLCAADESCSKRTDDLAASMKSTTGDMPDRFWFLPIKEGNVRLASFWGLMESTETAAPLSGPMTLGSWMSAAHGDAGGFWFQSVLSDLAFPTSFVWGDLASVTSEDTAAARRYFAQRHDSILGNPGTEFLWGGGRLMQAWPTRTHEREYSRMRKSNVETLLIGGTLDGTTPPQAATKRVLPYLPNGHQVVLSELGHTDDFWGNDSKASTHLLSAFFDSGKVDDSLYTHRDVDFTPEVTQTALAKGIAGTMIGFAVTALLSLLLMARRVHRRGSFGRKAAAALRSVFPLVLGLGGWFTGVIVVLVTMPTVPLDDELLGMLAIGLPIGLGIYLASARTKNAFLACTAGALAGAWLGFHTAGGLLAVITTIVGATAGANLAVISLEIVKARSVARAVATAPQPVEA